MIRLVGSRRVFLCVVLGLCAVACDRPNSVRMQEIAALIGAGRTDPAIAQLRPLLEQDPDDPEANLLLGIAWSRAGEPSLAVWPLERAMKSPEVGPEAAERLAEILLAVGDPEGALRAVEQLGALAGGGRDIELQRAQILLILGRYEEVLEIAAPLESDEFESSLAAAELRAGAHEQLNQTVEARRAWRDVSEKGRESEFSLVAISACLQYVDFLVRVEDLGEAQAEFDACLRRGALPSERLLAVALIEMRLDRTGAATTRLERALAEDPGTLDVALFLARIHEGRGNREEAVAVLESAATAARSPDAWARIAQWHRAEGDESAALAALERANESISEATDLHRFALADLLIDQGHLVRARKLLGRVSDPGLAALLDGAILLREGEAEQALERLSAGLVRWPHNAGARFLAGEAASAVGQGERAILEYREAMRMGPGETEAVLRLAGIYADRSDPRAAREVLEQGLAMREPKRDGVTALIAYSAARLALSMDDRPGALALFERRLEADPEMPAAANDLAWLLSKDESAVVGDHDRGRDLDRALALAQSAVARFCTPETLDTLAQVYRGRGDVTAASEVTFDARRLSAKALGDSSSCVSARRAAAKRSGEVSP